MIETWIATASTKVSARWGPCIDLFADNNDKWISQSPTGVMSGMRTSPAPELSDEAIEAARARRRMTVGDGDQMPTAGQELTAAAVPTNHPWATSKNRLTPEQEEAKRQEVLRLNRVTTRRSANGNGGQQ